MSKLAMTTDEEKKIDSQVEQMMDWAKTRRAEAEQLALDSARLMACTTDRVDRLKNQGLFKRCWNRFTGKTGEMERANVNDLIQMQKTGFRYMNMLQEQQMLMAHSLLALKNNLISLAVKEEETRNLINMLAQRTLERFEKLESRVDQLEISTNLQGWLLGLEEREYDEKIPTDYMRLFRVINDFYQIKKDNWNFNDLMFMRKAIRTVGLNPKQKLSLNVFIDKLTDEIQNEGVGFEAYGQAITLFKPEGVENYSKFVLENISSPVFVSMHGLKTQYMDRLDIVEELQDEMNITAAEALKRLLRRSIGNMNVNLDYEFPLAETAIEILGCLRLAENLALAEASSVPAIEESEPQTVEIISTEKIEPHILDIDNLTMGKWEESPIQLTYGNSPTQQFGSIIHSKYGFIYADSTGIWNTADLRETKRVGESGNIKSLYDIRNDILALSDSTITQWNQSNTWDVLKICKKFANMSIIYEHIFNNKDNIYIYTKSVKKKLKNNDMFSILDKSKDTFDTSVILYGRDINDLSPYYINEKYQNYNLYKIIFIKDELLAVIGLDDEPPFRRKIDPLRSMRRHFHTSLFDHNDADSLIESVGDGDKLITSTDGYNWQTSFIPYPNDIYAIGNSCIVKVVDDLYIFDIDKNERSDKKIKKPKFSLNNIINYPEYGIALMYDNPSKKENNYTIWVVNEKLERTQVGKFTSKPVGICYTGKQLVVTCESGQLFYREVY